MNAPGEGLESDEIAGREGLLFPLGEILTPAMEVLRQKDPDVQFSGRPSGFIYGGMLTVQGKPFWVRVANDELGAPRCLVECMETNPTSETQALRGDVSSIVDEIFTEYLETGKKTD